MQVNLAKLQAKINLRAKKRKAKAKKSHFSFETQVLGKKRKGKLWKTL